MYWRMIPLLILWSAGVRGQDILLTMAAHQVAHFSFNSCQVTDHTGYSEDALRHGRVHCWCGVDQDGLLFDGESDYVVFPGRINRYFSSSDFTFSFYISPWTQLPFQQVLFTTLTQREGVGGMDITYDPVKPQVIFRFVDVSGLPFGRLEIILDEGKWHHLALVREGGHLHGYHNGEYMHSLTQRCRQLDLQTTTPLHFGKCLLDEGPRRPYRGMLDEMRLFDRALSSSDIWELYQMHPVEEAQEDCYSSDMPDK
jgi:hypothetical protein